MGLPALRIYEMDLPRRDEPGQTFHLTFYSPPEHAALKGMILVAHDLGENANSYRQLAKEALVPAGFAVVVPDLPGFGQTPGKAGVSSETACKETIQATLNLLQKEANGQAIFLLGQGMGGSVILNYLLDREERHRPDGTVYYEGSEDQPFYAAIISSPWLELDSSLPPFVYQILAPLGRLLPQLTLHKRFDPALLTDDRKVQMDFEQDKYSHDLISFRLLAELWRMGRRVKQDAGQIHLPILFMFGSEDRIVSVAAIEELCERLPSYMKVMEWPGFLHSLHNMQERAAVYRTLYEYLETCLEQGRGWAAKTGAVSGISSAERDGGVMPENPEQALSGENGQERLPRFTTDDGAALTEQETGAKSEREMDSKEKVSPEILPDEQDDQAEAVMAGHTKETDENPEPARQSDAGKAAGTY